MEPSYFFNLLISIFEYMVYLIPVALACYLAYTYAKPRLKLPPRPRPRQSLQAIEPSSDASYEAVCRVRLERRGDSWVITFAKLSGEELLDELRREVVRRG